MRVADRWLFWLLVSFVSPVVAQPFSFVALGDLPYGDAEKSYPRYRSLIGAINRAQPEFSIHVGDLKDGSTLCSDQEYLAQKDHFSLFERGVVYTPGDNDWTDCHRLNNGSYDPVERLEKLRQLFFKPEESLGRSPISLTSQAGVQPEYARFIENQRWVFRDVLFVTVHIVGSNNNFEARDARAVSEFFERDRANIAWIQAAFAEATARKYQALVFAFQADALISRSFMEDFPSWSGFRNSIGQTLLPLAAEWGKPVLLIHGDSHQYHFDQPFKLKKKVLTNVMRLQVPGASDVRALRVTVDTTGSPTFRAELLAP